MIGELATQKINADLRTNGVIGTAAEAEEAATFLFLISYDCDLRQALFGCDLDTVGSSAPNQTTSIFYIPCSVFSAKGASPPH
jgi:hypothetical protein